MLWVVLSLGIPFAVGYAVDRTLRAGSTALVWGGLVRIFLFHHMTWSVNSICHTFGRRATRRATRAATTGSSPLPTFGEGWHNNHHAFPASAIHGLGRWQVDVSWWTIRGLERLGLAWDVKVSDAETQRRAAARRRGCSSAARPESARSSCARRRPSAGARGSGTAVPGARAGRSRGGRRG